MNIREVMFEAFVAAWPAFTTEDSERRELRKVIDLCILGAEYQNVPLESLEQTWVEMCKSPSGKYKTKPEEICSQYLVLAFIKTQIPDWAVDGE